MNRTIEMTEMTQGIFEQMPEDKFRALGYLSSWSLNTYSHINIFFVDKTSVLFSDYAIVTHYYNKKEDISCKYTIVALFDNRDNKFTMHS